VGRGAYHRLADQAIAELGAKSKSCVTPLLFFAIALCDKMLDCSIALCDNQSVKEIEFTSAAVRQWRKLSAAARAQIDLKLKTFAETGIGDVKALKGAAGMRLRSGDWRVLFTMKANTITIHAVGHRREIYD
jgi:mRNA interferase RelE/StbE